MEIESQINKKFMKEITSGISWLILISVMSKSEESMYGYQITKLLKAGSKEKTPFIKKGTLYPILRSLEKNGLLESEVEPSISGPPRKYYSITDMGRKAKEEWLQIWNQTKEYVDAILEGDVNDPKTN